jgi:plasmid stabilization system protein ParE
MSRQLIIRPEAEVDLAQANDWYERQREGLSNEFRICIEEAMDRIDRMPELHAPIYKGVRRCLVRRFPYAIFYKIEETRILVIGVMHARRDPAKWRSRI